MNSAIVDALSSCFFIILLMVVILFVGAKFRKRLLSTNDKMLEVNEKILIQQTRIADALEAFKNRVIK